MKVVVSGGAGFIGSHVADAFVGRGDEVLVVDDLSSGSREDVPGEAAFAEFDIADADRVEEGFTVFRPEFVCHLAAQASVTVSVKDPRRDFDSNVLGTFNVLRSATDLGARTIFASTGGALYGEGAPIPTDESYVPQPLSPYGASKQAAEAYVGAFERFHGIENAVLRLGNVYGPRQSPHGEAGVVAIFSERLIRGQSVVAYGHGTPTRDYVHVRDIARAFVTLSDTPAAGIFNLGWGREVSVLEILDGLQRAAGTAVEPELEPLRPGELTRSAIDSTAAERAFGWKPEIELDAGLADTFRWYSETYGE
ncbi:MAG TPA: NAD-dependent epimerase/dehydratase family protein [Gaiellaceae bacterium]